MTGAIPATEGSWIPHRPASKRATRPARQSGGVARRPPRRELLRMIGGGCKTPERFSYQVRPTHPPVVPVQLRVITPAVFVTVNVFPPGSETAVTT